MEKEWSVVFCGDPENETHDTQHLLRKNQTRSKFPSEEVFKKCHQFLTITLYGKRLLYETHHPNKRPPDATPKIVDPDNSPLLSSLRNHQMDALGWMIQRENDTNGGGGIPADDMGSGKTITMIGLIVLHDSHPPGTKTLVIVPLSVLETCR